MTVGLNESDLRDIHGRVLADMDQTRDTGLKLYSFEWKLGLALIFFLFFSGCAVILYFAYTGSDRDELMIATVGLTIGAVSLTLFLRSLVRGWMKDLNASIENTTNEAYDELERGLDQVIVGKGTRRDS